MKTLVAFWNKDLVNKLILVISIGLALGVISLTILVLRMPAGKSLRGVALELIPALVPTPTLAPPTPSPTATWFPRPTRTPNPLQSTATLPSLGPTEAPPASPTPTQDAAARIGAACIPKNPPQTGRVVDILDGNTIKVLIDDKVYVVRYLGTAAPDASNPFYQAAMSRNSELVFGQDVTLTGDTVDKDSGGRLLRYVTLGGKFVNLELISEGLAAAVDAGPDLACSAVFVGTGQVALRDKVGQWSLSLPSATP